MYRETTLISDKDLYKDIPDRGEFRNVENGFEKYWKVPDDIGHGFIYLTKFRPGLVLGIGDYQYFERLRISSNTKFSLFVIGFGLSANIWCTPGNRQVKKIFLKFSSGRSFISYAPEWQGMVEYPAGTLLRSVSIYIDPLLLNTFIDSGQDRIPPIIDDIINGNNEKQYHQSLINTPMINTAIHEILNCPYQGTLRRLYLESKTLELIAHVLAQLFEDRNGSNSRNTLLPGDIKSIREARNILIRNLEDPPSLSELARQAGINKNKLNYNFRQVFGTSVFDYLHIHRLEQARKMLKSKEKNVTEVAFDVGYDHHSNFTRAFKKHFGTNPSDYLH